MKTILISGAGIAFSIDLENGTPMRTKRGEIYTHLSRPEDRPGLMATLTRQIRTVIHGDSAGFNRRIEYRRAWLDLG